MNLIGIDSYLKVATGANHRGIGLTSKARNLLLNHKEVIKIPIDWIKLNIKHNHL